MQYLTRYLVRGLKELNHTLIAGINVLTDSFDPVTGCSLFDLQWLTLSGGMWKIKKVNPSQLRDWIRNADKDKDDNEPREVMNQTCVLLQRCARGSTAILLCSGLKTS